MNPRFALCYVINYVNEFEKRWLPHTFINTDFNYLKYCILERKTDAWMQLVKIL